MKETKNTTQEVPDRSPGGQEKHKEWEKKYGGYIELEFEDKYCVIRDPLNDMNIMRQALAALSKSRFAYVESILNNCFLEGDEEIKTDAACINGLMQDVGEITEVPDAEINRTSDSVEITINGLTVAFKYADRKTIMRAEKDNPGMKPLVEDEYLLKSCIVNLDDLEKIKSHTPTYLGFLFAARELKARNVAIVKKHLRQAPKWD